MHAIVPAPAIVPRSNAMSIPAFAELLIRVLLVPAAGYFLVLFVSGLISRTVFDLVAVMCLLALLMLYLASVGLDAAMVLVMLAAHVLTTACARRQVNRVQRRRTARRQTVAGGH